MGSSSEINDDRQLQEMLEDEEGLQACRDIMDIVFSCNIKEELSCLMWN